MWRSWYTGYCRAWPRIGLGLAAAIGTVALGGHPPLTRGQRLAAANLAALLVHQFEEYGWPGWFPGQFNHGLLSSDQPRVYPLNPVTAMWVNVALGYPFYLAPVVAPRQVPVALAPALFGIGQVLGHGVVIPRLAGDRYSPGFASAIVLHLPIGIAEAREARRAGATRADLAGALALVAGAGLVVAMANAVGRTRSPRVAFTARQMGHHDVAPTAGTG
jgi:hypothetical protein